MSWLLTIQRRFLERADSKAGSFFIDQREKDRERKVGMLGKGVNLGFEINFINDIKTLISDSPYLQEFQLNSPSSAQKRNKKLEKKKKINKTRRNAGKQKEEKTVTLKTEGRDNLTLRLEMVFEGVLVWGLKDSSEREEEETEGSLLKR